MTPIYHSNLHVQKTTLSLIRIARSSKTDEYTHFIFKRQKVYDRESIDPEDLL
ncbi:MAG: hypothetical protein ACFFD4_04285 [Candidatus Odinarchaeota archaeon]